MTAFGTIVLALLQRKGPMHTPGICCELGRDYSATVPIMTALRRTGHIAVVGKARDFGFTDVMSTAPVYDVVRDRVVKVEPQRTAKEIAAEMPAPAPDHVPPHYKHPAQARKRTKSGSGVIAGPITIGSGYRWGSTRW